MSPPAIRLVCLTLICSLAVVLAPAADSPRAKTGRKWVDMDYGPFLTASIEAPQPATNIAFKGIAIRLGSATNGGHNEAVVFDTDLLRYSAGWTGNFVALKGVVFDGEHWAYPQISGDQVFGNPSAPGWGRDGSFEDPRPFIYGPLPRDWAHWKGLFLHGEQVVLSYTVGDAEVLELPGLAQGAGLTAFARTLNVGKSSRDLTLQIAFEAGRPGVVMAPDTLAPAPAGVLARASFALLPAPKGELEPGGNETNALEQGLIGHWDFEQVTGDEARDRSPGQRKLKLQDTRAVEARDGRVLDFNGKGYGELERSEDLDFLNGDLSFAAWINLRQDGTILARTQPSGPWVPDAAAWFVRNGRLVFDVGWVGAVESQRAIPPGQWHHVAMTWSHQEGAVTLYLDGKTDGQGAVKPRNPATNHVFRVGFAAPNFPAAPYLQGQLDELRIYRRRLGAGEVRALAGVKEGNLDLAVGVVGAPAQAKWLVTTNGHIRLEVPAAATPARFKVLLAGLPPDALARFGRLVQETAPAADLQPLTQGGPSHWGQTLTTQGKLGPDSGPYAIDALTWPEENPWDSWMRFGGFDFFKDPTRAAISTWNGDVWIVSGLDDQLERLTWRRFATGLYQPLGLKIVDDRIYVLGRDQITRLHDRNGDGEADFYENFNNDTLNTEHFHEFVLDLQTDAAGDFYYMKSARHARDALHPQHGTLMKVSKDGARSEILAKGFRAPNGLEVAPTGEWYTTDQEGYWMPANRLNLIQRGGFYGNTWSWFPEGKPTRYDPPICWIHPRVDRSPSTMAWVTSDRWGPLKDKLLSLSYGVGRIFLVMQESVHGVRQGGITPLPLEFDTGIMRSRFSPRDGQFYVCGLFGWAGNKTTPGGFYRVRATGKPLHLPTDLHVATNGVVLQFSEPLDPVSATDVGNYSVETWDYRWTQNYGSPDFKRDGEKGRDRLPVASAQLSRDGRTVFLKLPGLAPVMQMHVQMNVKAADGASIQTFVHNTIHGLGADTGESRLGEAALGATNIVEFKLQHEAPGLLLSFESSQAPEWAKTDIVRTRLAALNVPLGSAPTPFLPPGPFRATWEGYLRLDLAEAYHFFAWGRGRVSATVNDQEAIPLSEATPPDVKYPAVQLKAGLNRIRIRYESPPTGEGVFRLFWRSSQVPWEPVPPGAFFHEGTNPALRESEDRRMGRQLFASRLCVKCHKPQTPFETTAMPELAAGSPNLEDILPSYQPGWLARYLENPAAGRTEVMMPTPFHGPAQEIKAQVQDVAAFLNSLVPPVLRAEAAEPLPDGIAAKGKEHFATLGCVACHWLPGDRRLEPDTRISLAHVRTKWLPSGLTTFLRQPAMVFPWTRMPDFQLAEAEAQALAAYLLAAGDAAPGDVVGAPAGDPERGRQRARQSGCANCHELSLPPMEQPPASLDQLAGANWNKGCLADRPEGLGRAPDFRFRPEELAALRVFLKRDVASLRTTVWPEFAEHQIKNLRCNACHEREDARDFWFAIESAAGTPKSAAANTYDEEDAQDATIHRQRPPLTWTGEKLRTEWLQDFLAGRIPYKPRPKLQARMPAFPAYAAGIAYGLAMQHGCATSSPTEPPVAAPLAGIGQALVQKGALACVDCHAVGDQPALAGKDTATINFAHIPERLRREYYDRYVQDPPRLLPGTMMPKFVGDDGKTGIAAHFEGDARQQFDAIWNYMRTVRIKP